MRIRLGKHAIDSARHYCNPVVRGDYHRYWHIHIAQDSISSPLLQRVLEGGKFSSSFLSSSLSCSHQADFVIPSIVFWLKRYLMIFAGLPPTTAKGGTSLTKTLPAPPTAPFPIVNTEGRIVTSMPT